MMSLIRIAFRANIYNTMADQFLYLSLGRFIVYYANMLLAHQMCVYLSQNLPPFTDVIAQWAAYAAAHEIVILQYLELATVLLRCVFMVLIGYEIKRGADEIKHGSKGK